MKVLLVEDDHGLSRALEKALLSEGFVVDLVNTGEAALFLVEESSHDVVILDVGLPDISGFEVLERIRAGNRQLPVIMLTARDALEDKLTGLDKGADDYLTKPFDIPELIARLRVIVRRGGASPGDLLEVGPVTLDRKGHTVTLEGEPVELSGREYTLLVALIDNVGRIMSREQLEAKLYAWGEDIASNTIEVHIHHLRKKLGKTFIKNVRGIGYTIPKQ